MILPLAIHLSLSLVRSRLGPVIHGLSVVFGSLLVDTVATHASRSSQGTVLTDSSLVGVAAIESTPLLVHHLLNLVADYISHLLLLFIHLHFDLSP